MPRPARPPPLPLLACGTSAPRRPPFRGRTPPAFCHVQDGLGVRSVTPGPRSYPRGARDQDGGAPDSRTCAPGGSPSCCAASPALTASEISPALSVNATISPGATAANVSRYGTVSWRRPQRTTIGDPKPMPSRSASEAAMDSCTLPNRSTDMTSPSASPSCTLLVGAGSVTRSATSILVPAEARSRPAARCAATGVKMSRPWNVGDTGCSHSSPLVSWYALVAPPCAATGQDSSPV